MYGLSLKACPHLFPKQETLYPETGDFVAENGNKVSGYRVACFRIQPLVLGTGVWTGLKKSTGTKHNKAQQHLNNSPSSAAVLGPRAVNLLASVAVDKHAKHKNNN